MNQVTLYGNLGADPESRVTRGGQFVLKLRMATTDRYKDSKDGQWKDATEWHSVVVWGPRGEALSQRLSKGSRILVSGKLRTTSYEDRDGNKRYTTEVIANDVEFDFRKGPASEEPPTAVPADEPAGDDIPW